MDRLEEQSPADFDAAVAGTSNRDVSNMKGFMSFARSADTYFTKPNLSAEHSDEFATATSSPVETDSEENQEIAFRLRSVIVKYVRVCR